MSLDTARTDKRHNEEEAEPTFRRRLGRSSLWKMLFALALVLVAVAGLCQVSGLSGVLRPLPPTATPTLLPTPTLPPTLTPTSTPMPTATPEPQVMPGGQAIIRGTEEQKLRLRAEPGLTQETLRILDEGTQLKVLEGPETMDGYKWWKVQTEDGQIGWVAGNWLAPVIP